MTVQMNSAWCVYVSESVCVCVCVGGGGMGKVCVLVGVFGEYKGEQDETNNEIATYVIYHGILTQLLMSCS